VSVKVYRMAEATVVLVAADVDWILFCEKRVTASVSFHTQTKQYAQTHLELRKVLGRV
jgi:hypothetical protein